MRRNRIIWFCLWVLSIVGISFKGGAVTYGFFTLLTLVPVFSALYLLAVYMFFHIYQDLEQRFVSVNEPVTYRFALVNEYPVQFVGIRVRFFSAFSTITDLNDETEYELKPHTRIEKKTRLICRYRGEYKIGIKEIEIRDFFCLFRIRYKNRECITAVVKPRLIKIDDLGGTELSDAVKESVYNKSEPDVISREYLPGDDRRFINWSQSARTGKLMTREFTGSDNREAAIITDTFRYSADPSEYLPSENKILEITLAVSYYFCRNNICAAEYHLGDRELVRITAENTYKFEEFYNNVSEIGFSSLNTHGLLYESAVRRRDIADSAMIFLILSLWDAETDALLSELEKNNPNIAVCFVGDGEKGKPDLSGHKCCCLINISPFGDLTGEWGK